MDFPGQNNFNQQTDYRATAPKNNHFAFASVVFGGLSILSLCTGVIPIFTGSLGIVFVLLSHRRKTHFSSQEVIGLSLSSIGLVIGLFLTIFTLVTVFIPIMTDPEAYQQWDAIYQEMYGISLSELLSSYQ